MYKIPYLELLSKQLFLLFVIEINLMTRSIPSVGISWRWMVAAAEDKSGLQPGLCLQLQGLPCSTNHLNSSPSLMKDNTPVLVLASIPAYCAMWDGIKCSGPVPIFFSTDPENAVAR